jgi:hypothetical protein
VHDNIYYLEEIKDDEDLSAGRRGRQLLVVIGFTVTHASFETVKCMVVPFLGHGWKFLLHVTLTTFRLIQLFSGSYPDP